MIRFFEGSHTKGSDEVQAIGQSSTGIVDWSDQLVLAASLHPDFSGKDVMDSWYEDLIDPVIHMIL